MPTLDDSSLRNPEIIVLKAEFESLADLVCASPRATPGIALLWQELRRATVLADAGLPGQVVKMGSWVRFTELDSGRSGRVRLSYPDEATADDALSITSSLGAALIGLACGEVFRWRTPDGRIRSVRIDAVEPPPCPH